METSGETLDFLLTAKRDAHAAQRCLRKACIQDGKLRAVIIDLDRALKQRHRTQIDARRKKDLNNIIERDDRRIERKTRPMLGFTSFL